jgi:hypothetical protein
VGHTQLLSLSIDSAVKKCAPKETKLKEKKRKKRTGRQRKEMYQYGPPYLDKFYNKIVSSKLSK